MSDEKKASWGKAYEANAPQETKQAAAPAQSAARLRPISRPNRRTAVTGTAVAAATSTCCRVSSASSCGRPTESFSTLRCPTPSPT